MIQDEEALYAISLYHQPRPGKPQGPEPDALRQFIALAATKKQEILVCFPISFSNPAQNYIIQLSLFLLHNNSKHLYVLVYLLPKMHKKSWLHSSLKRIMYVCSPSARLIYFSFSLPFTYQLE